MEMMKQQMGKLQEGVKEKDILILNERHLLEEHTKKTQTFERY
jgi:hypothetical protein